MEIDYYSNDILKRWTILRNIIGKSLIRINRKIFFSINNKIISNSQVGHLLKNLITVLLKLEKVHGCLHRTKT